MNNISPFLTIACLVCGILGIIAIVLFIKMTFFCYKRYNYSWFRVIHPLHEIVFIPTLIGFFGIESLYEYLPTLAEKLESALPVFIALSVAAIIRRLFRHISHISIWINIGCLIIEIVFAALILICVIALYMIILLIAGVFIALCVSSGGSSHSSSSSSEGHKQHLLHRGVLGTDIIYVYSVNGNMNYLHGYDGTIYRKLSNQYVSDDPDDDDFYYLF